MSTALSPVLLFPGGRTKTPPPAPSGMQFIDVRTQLPRAPWNDAPPRRLLDIEFLVIHWDGTGTIADGYDPIARYRWEAQYHIDKDWGSGSHGGGLMYAIKIDRNGQAYTCRNATDVLWHATAANIPGYAICLDATVDSPPTSAQLAGLKRVIEAKRREFGLDYGAVYGHGELTQYGNSTACPGPDALQWVRDYRAGRV